MHAPKKQTSVWIILVGFLLICVGYKGIMEIRLLSLSHKQIAHNSDASVSTEMGSTQDREFVMPENYKDLLQPTNNTMFLLPNDDQLQQMSSTQLVQLYWRYIQTIQVLCRNQLRVGKLNDGGKEVCIDASYYPRKPCLVYSFGINFQFDFDLDIVKHFGCEVHGFDPSMNLRNGKIPSEIKFHLEGLGNKTGMQNKWKIKTLQDFMKSLGHENRTLDILKIDIEGAEWLSLPEIITSGVIHEVKQLQVETHYGMRWRIKQLFGDTTEARQLGILRQLYEAGFRLFMHERNLVSIRPHPDLGEYTYVNEISLLNMRYYK